MARVEGDPMGTSGFEIGRRRGASTLLTAVVVAFALAACGGGSDAATAGDGTPLSEAEFVARADRICAETASRFDELPDPDGEGGAKPLGIGTFMRTWVANLRVPQPPADVAGDWQAGLDLLDRAADKLDAAEAGDPNAQSEALWDLEARAQQRFDAMHVPFRACFGE